MQALLKATEQPSLFRVLTTGRPRALAQTTRVRILRPAASLRTVVYHAEDPNSRELKIDDTQVFGSEVKLNPSQSEANVAADRGELDPLPTRPHEAILLDAGETSQWTAPTESEAYVHADKYMDDPLKGKVGGYC